MNKPLILVVEDDAPIRNLMTTTLKAHDYRYLVADCGEEALRQAMGALVSLTEGNRLVGIISHVSELKERIDRQIVVTKDKTGGSRAEIRTESGI